MKNYELNIIAKVDTEPAMQKLTEDVKKILEKSGANIIKDTLPAQMKLGYHINDQKEGSLLSFLFKVEEEKIKDIKNTITEDKRILRNMIVNEKTYQKKNDTRERKPEIKTDDSIKIKPVTEEEKTDLEDIDKKLDEMLNK